MKFLLINPLETESVSRAFPVLVGEMLSDSLYLDNIEEYVHDEDKIVSV